MEVSARPSMILRPFNKPPVLNTATALVFGTDGVGKHDLAKYMVMANQQQKSNFNVLVRTATQLPLPTENDSTRPRIDLICFMVDLTNKDSMKTIEDSMKYIDQRYFLGRACIVATKVKCVEKRSIHIEILRQFAQYYGMSVLFGSFETKIECITLARQILTLTEIAGGLRKNISPLLLMSTKTPAI